MKEFDHCYTLSSEWHNELAQKMGAAVKDDKLMQLPESIGKGYSIFLEVIPGISVLFLDFVLSTPIKLKRLRSDGDLRILHFDLSDEINAIKIEDSTHQIGYRANLGFAVTSNDIENTHLYTMGKRILSLRLIIDKKLLVSLTNGGQDNASNMNKFGKRALYFCDYIDSNSKILMHSIKKRPILNVGFDLYLKGVSLRLLANMCTRYSPNKISSGRMSIKKKDLDAFSISKKYLLGNLKKTFPGVTFLAAMAKMSTSKYKALFHTIEKTSPNVFFEKNKMALAKKMVGSGSYLNLDEIVSELNYKKLEYFDDKYSNSFGRKPTEDFMAKKRTH